MSAIEGVGPSAGGRLPNRTRGTKGNGFAVPTATRSAAASAPEPAALVTAAGMLALQEIDTEPPQDRAARRHGRALLSALSRLQRHLLAGATDPASLEELEALARDVPRATDAALAGVVDGVVLRARIELARRGR